MNSFQHYSFSFSDVAPSKAEVLDFLHSADLEEEHPAVLFISRILNEIDISEISGGYVIKENQPIVVGNGVVEVENVVLSLGKQVCGYVKEAAQVALFLCTAGEYFTQKSKELNDGGEFMEAFILDAIGSLTVENAMNKIQDKLFESLKSSGLNISNRYSPGYCNWNLSDQKKLFKLIGANPTGISINRSCLMTPRKSVSGLIGIGENIKRREYGCKICNNKDCIYRKISNFSGV